ncbi:hypothetical protein MKW98_030794 [Papaver atlanticum]|uniref:Uncharacterized protein n=1 Tax=Papaver atlanticum TaxID=357466 RepID=A0AAD4S0W4_9MAGN|nr:hypothetical protein MKW98_030794 [Papaver atlanticum]
MHTHLEFNLLLCVIYANRSAHLVAECQQCPTITPPSRALLSRSSLLRQTSGSSSRSAISSSRDAIVGFKYTKPSHLRNTELQDGEVDENMPQKTRPCIRRLNNLTADQYSTEFLDKSWEYTVMR